ncbi:hypothetical protein BJ508DRAFT_327600 [Ascobolus immersus RN42]|uniref:Uncharacterized protein n=1 Tax=Ascobolus immersus RN42 TaxID=1160509 RepID=A0A3N4I3R9_ASCIM|nr:hypothetical protein BJ508DRAFT_327600 [Ascobolus immersus RN42]
MRGLGRTVRDADIEVRYGQMALKEDDEFRLFKDEDGTILALVFDWREGAYKVGARCDARLSHTATVAHLRALMPRHEVRGWIILTGRDQEGQWFRVRWESSRRCSLALE